MGYEYLTIKRDPRLIPWGTRPMTPEMRAKLNSGGGSRDRQALSERALYIGAKQQPLMDRAKDVLWVSNMASILAIAGVITFATISAPAILSFGLTLGTLFAGAALVERRFKRRSIRNRK